MKIKDVIKEHLKELNHFEVVGIMRSMSDYLEYDIDHLRCGIDRCMINLQNFYCHPAPWKKYPKLGAIGLTRSEDLLLEYWDEEENNTRYCLLTKSQMFSGEHPYKFDVKKWEVIY